VYEPIKNAAIPIVMMILVMSILYVDFLIIFSPFLGNSSKFSEVIDIF
jgi:hypothetical protein